jgi:hypothetical protein
MSRRYVIPTLLFTFVILVAVPALAQDGVQSIGACTIIDKPGSYVLARDITATLRDLKQAPVDRFTVGLACIVIVADFVSLDLQGHTITGPEAWDSGNAGIFITADARGNLPTAAHIRNGGVTGFTTGVAVEGTGHVVEQVRVARNQYGISLRGNGIKVKEVIAVSNYFGILWFGDHGVSVENCQISSNGGTGILQWPPDEWGQPFGSRIVGNTVSNNGGYGIYAYCPSLIVQNMVYSNGSGPRDNIVVVTDPFNTPCTRSDNSPEP